MTRDEVLEVLKQWALATSFSYEAGEYPFDMAPTVQRLVDGDGGLLKAVQALYAAVYYGPEDTATTVAGWLGL